MINVDEARARIAEHATVFPDAESIPLAAALGRFLMQPILADRDDPPFDKSLMDGYAVRADDVPGRLRKVGRIEAGQPELPTVGPGEGVWINTGAPLPPGADTVVPVELTKGEIEIERGFDPGQNVLPRGRLVRAGEELCAGRLTPERIAVCAAAGVEPVPVVRRPRVAILATGNELDADPGPHSIRNSNGPLLAALFAPIADVVDLGVVGDSMEELQAKLREGLACDAVVTTGGVSKGDLDLVRPALEALDAEVLIHGVKLQPGKPFLFARRGDAFAFGLPGNPASALVCADLFVVPFLLARQGADFAEVPAPIHAELEAPVKASPHRRRVFPCVLRGATVTPLPWRSSADLYTLTRGNAYMVLEAGADGEAGDRVPVLVPDRFGR
ncbi:MAG: molybdopterin molybdotransferase MoeA [Planctomycetota bacterium]